MMITHKSKEYSLMTKVMIILVHSLNLVLF